MATTMTAALRFYEAWTVEPDGHGGREVTDECGHDHETLAEAREWHRMHAGFNVMGVTYLTQVPE